MTPLEALLREEIAAHGPIPFSQFMRQALYHPEYGYYTSPERDPFGKSGDFYTAEQLQPVFGTLIAQYAHALCAERQLTNVLEIGAGREEMASAFQNAGFAYTAVDVGRGALRESFEGFIFANELFDALPVDVAAPSPEGGREMLVTCGDRFTWCEGAMREELSAYIAEHITPFEDDERVEVAHDALRHLETISARLHRGFALIIDYGYTDRERVRFPQGTLMSYKNHEAVEDVLLAPGTQDITAHVNFSALMRHAVKCGFRVVRFETMAQMLMRAGEPDQFARALSAPNETGRVKLSLQLKQLLFGMGETFRTLLLEKI